MSATTMVVVAAAVVLGCVIPWVVVRMFVPTLEGILPARRTNYAGRTVFIGLGAVWVVWAVGMFLFDPIVRWLGGVETADGRLPTMVVPQAQAVAALAVVACALGMVDDALGTGDDRGFRGHFRALRAGRISTGMLKLIGISAMSIWAAYSVGFEGISGVTWRVAAGPAWRGALAVLLAAAGVALTSNFVNLTDLRPGRALKAYLVLAAAGVLAGASFFAAYSQLTPSGVGSAAIWALVLVGPVLAVWRYDLGERGMLGDAGANAMGAVAGLLIVSGLPMWGLVIYVALMLALNLASERVSFSKVIDSTPPLRWLDRIGRSKKPAADSTNSETSNA